VKTKLRCDIGTRTFKVAVVATAEKDILVQLSADELVSKFSAAADRRLDLGQTFMCALLISSRLPSHLDVVP
jgi:hypothetical protein